MNAIVMRQPLIRPWDTQDVEILIDMLNKHEPVRRIAHRLRRSQSSIRARMNKLGLGVSPKAPTMRQMRRLLSNTPASP